MRFLTFLVLLSTSACQHEPSWNGSLETLLRSQPERFSTVMSNPDKFRAQIIYTQIDRNEFNEPSFQSFTYRLNADEYFYPASTVKLPVAALALEKIRQLNRPGLDRDTTMLTGKAEAFQTEALVDHTSPSGLPSVGQYIRKSILVSDNDAFNRLYEFLGHHELNQRLGEKGFSHTRIIHRLGSGLDAQQNQATNPVRFVKSGNTIYQQAATRSDVRYLADTSIMLGVAEIVAGERIDAPKDFAEKNAFALKDLHDTVKRLMFPASAVGKQRFNLSDDDYAFLRRAMSQYPGESDVEAYQNSTVYPDGFVKFLMFGGDEPKIPRHLRIFNKVGDAYGFLTDAAYIVDYDAGIEFLLAATVYTNENQTFNDDNYEYAQIGLPFLRNLGQTIYEVELKRKRRFTPDFSAHCGLWPDSHNQCKSSVDR